MHEQKDQTLLALGATPCSHGALPYFEADDDHPDRCPRRATVRVHFRHKNFSSTTTDAYCDVHALWVLNTFRSGLLIAVKADDL